MTEEILRLYPEKTRQPSKDELAKEVGNLAERGKLYGLTTCYSLSRFIIFNFELGLHFELLEENKPYLDLLRGTKNQQEKSSILDEWIFGL